MGITKSVFGVTKDGKQVDAFLIENNNNMKVNLITWGATLQRILVKDKDENEIDLLLGFDDMEGFENRHDYQGVIVGPVANRISKGGLTIDGERVPVTTTVIPARTSLLITVLFSIITSILQRPIKIKSIIAYKKIYSN